MILVEALHQRCPGSLPPSDDALLLLTVGDSVKIGTSNERFWVVIQSIMPASSTQDYTFTGALERDLINTTEARRGDIIQFQGKHIYAIEPLVQVYTR